MSSGISKGVRLHICCRCISGFMHGVDSRRHINFSHDNVIGVSSVVGGRLRIFNLHLSSWRVGHRHVLLENIFLVGRGCGNTFFYLMGLLFFIG